MAKMSKAAAMWAKMEKHHGNYLKSYEDISRETKSISTGSHTLDDALGVGGVPMGRIVQFAGRESSGKSFMSFQVMKNWQARHPENWCYFIDAEQKLDLDWWPKLGIDVDRVKILPANDGVEIFTSLCGVPNKKDHTKEKDVPGILDMVKEQGGAEASGLGVIVLDSVASVQPPMEAASAAGKVNMALMGRFLPPELRKLTTLLAQTGVCFIAINQVRVNPGQLYGNPETTTGGSAWKHHCSTMINMSPITPDDKKKKQFMAGGDTPIGHRIRARIDKNSVSMSRGRTCEFDIGYLQGVIHKHEELVELGIKYGLIDRPNNRTYTYNKEKWVGRDNVEAYFADEGNASELLERIKSAPAATVKVVEKEEEENGTD